MKSVFSLSSLMIGVASLTLSTSMWAHTLNEFQDDMWLGEMPEPDYVVMDKSNEFVTFLDGIDKGHEVSDEGATKHDYDCLKGDKLTNLKTDRSGIIKGVKHQGTMDVTMPNGKTVRYQYVTFKVQPVK